MDVRSHVYRDQTDAACAPSQPIRRKTPPSPRVTRMVVQPKLEVGAADDRHEREADAVAARVSNWLAAPRTDTSDHPGRIRRVSAAGPTGGVLVDTDTEQAIAGAGAGAGLAPDVRRDMESAFGGADFSAVRVHGDTDASTLSRSLQARAFTHGSDIYFRDGVPDTSHREGRELMAHELTHTLQQSGRIQRRIQTKRDKVFTPPNGKHPATDWVEYSGGNKPKRSPELKAIDKAVDKWVKGNRTMGGAVDGNISDLVAIENAIALWRAKKNGAVSYRDTAMAALEQLITQDLQTFRAKKQKRIDDANVAAPLFENYKKIDAETGRFAKKQLVDVKQSDFEPDNQRPSKMAHTDKNDDGTLTDEALDNLDQLQIAEAQALVLKAQSMTITVDPSVDPEDLRQALANRENPLSGRTDVPELENATDPNAEPAGEVTEPMAVAGTTLTVTYDKSDVHAAERMAAVREAVTLINATDAHVPNLKVYLPKAGRSVSVNSKCEISVGNSKIADAQFLAPDFFVLSSSITGNPKQELTPTGDFKFLSTALGADTALVNTTIHELGHALHYHNDRGRFYNLNWAMFSGRAEDGRTYQDIAEAEVSAYGNNPREMVAEVFLATIKGGKQFPDIVWEMYDAFGGCPL